MKKLAKNLKPGDRIVNGGTILGPALRRDIPLNRDAIGTHEIGFPIRYRDGGEAVRIFPKDREVEVEE